MTSWTNFLDNIKVTIRSDSSFFLVVKKRETQFNIPNICSKDFAMVFVIFYFYEYQDNNVLCLKENLTTCILFYVQNSLRYWYNLPLKTPNQSKIELLRPFKDHIGRIFCIKLIRYIFSKKFRKIKTLRRLVIS